MADFVFFSGTPESGVNCRIGDGFKTFWFDEPAGVFGHHCIYRGAGGGQLAGQIDRLVRGDSAADTQQDIKATKICFFLWHF